MVELFDCDLHRHDEFSSFDGFGKAYDLAKVAKAKGLTALGISNHGNMNGLVEHYMACKNNEIKPVLGIEAYFLPKFKETKNTYHLCLFAKNPAGYANLNRIVTDANKNNFYYKAIVTLRELKKYHDGVICTTACIGSYFAQQFLKGNEDNSIKMLMVLKEIFGEDLYVEIMPYELREEGLQEKINVFMMKAARKLKIKCILTSDSHYGNKKDFDTYIKLHEIKGHGDFALQYHERYMPKAFDMQRRFIRMHEDEDAAQQMQLNIMELVGKIDGDLMDNIEKNDIVFDPEIDAEKKIKVEIKKGLKRIGKQDDEEYVSRAKKEYKIISMHGFSDYFLIVQDYVNFAKREGIKVGPGRGSVCNCLVAYLLGITDTDPVYFGLDFTRFLREDKKKMPDVDLDFDIEKRQEVIDYIIERNKGKAAQICSYGLYKADNTLNDLFKVCGVDGDSEKARIKQFIKSKLEAETQAFHYDEVKDIPLCRHFNNSYNDIIKHFSKMYRMVRFIGTHAAGVAIVGSDIMNYAAVEKRGGKFSCVYDLSNLERINVLKFDMLGLKTMTEVSALEEATGEVFSYDWLEEKDLYRQFGKGNTDGIFQFEKGTAKQILIDIEADCFEDIAAANAMNRPGPLQLGMPEQYAHNKKNKKDVKKSKYYLQTKETYGTVVYQEQITAICREIGMLTPQDTDKVLKFMKGSQLTEKSIREKEAAEEIIRNAFIEGAHKNGMSKKEAYETFEKLIVYSFNKGHAVGYSLISLIMMYYKMHYPEAFWLVKLRYAKKEDFEKYKSFAVKSGSVILLPHINGSARFSMTNKYMSKMVGGKCLQEGLSSILGVGAKASEEIEAELKRNGPYKNYADLVSRVPKRLLNCRVLNALESAGAMEMDAKVFVSRCEKYNVALSTKNWR